MSQGRNLHGFGMLTKPFSFFVAGASSAEDRGATIRRIGCPGPMTVAGKSQPDEIINTIIQNATPVSGLIHLADGAFRARRSAIGEGRWMQWQ